MTDLEMLMRAKMYMDKLAQGINPIDDTTAPDDDIINNVRLSRCFFYVSDVLGRVIENGGTEPKKKVKRIAFDLGSVDIEKFEFSDSPITISDLLKRFDTIKMIENMKKPSSTGVTDWLVEIGMLTIIVDRKGANRKFPTVDGQQIGISTKTVTGQYGEYTSVVYDRNAQQFIIDNLGAALDFIENRKNKTE
ncbi:MAG: hypothetical protein IJZ89_02950 [Clostridia bacterium]|nr:hypothetical protein [Clostridia bacterium]